jgi:hypothetical protein
MSKFVIQQTQKIRVWHSPQLGIKQQSRSLMNVHYRHCAF